MMSSLVHLIDELENGEFLPGHWLIVGTTKHYLAWQQVVGQIPVGT